MKQERGNRNRLRQDLFYVTVWQHCVYKEWIKRPCFWLCFIFSFNMTHQALKSWILQAIDKESSKVSLYFPSLVRACLSGSWCWHSSPFKIQHACCICQLPFVSAFVKKGEESLKKGIWDKTDRLRQVFGCSVIQDPFALLAPHNLSDTCSILYVLTQSHISTWPVAEHHGSIEVNLHNILTSTQSQKMSLALLESLLPLNVNARLCAC